MFLSNMFEPYFFENISSFSYFSINFWFSAIFWSNHFNRFIFEYASKFSEFSIKKLVFSNLLNNHFDWCFSKFSIKTLFLAKKKIKQFDWYFSNISRVSANSWPTVNFQRFVKQSSSIDVSAHFREKLDFQQFFIKPLRVIIFDQHSIFDLFLFDRYFSNITRVTANFRSKPDCQLFFE